MFDIKIYQNMLATYKSDFSMPEWGLVVISILFVAIFIGLIIALIYLLIRKYLRFRKEAINQDELLDEVANLNGQVASLLKEKEEILAMKVSQLGLKPDESPKEEIGKQGDDGDSATNPDIRFSKLDQIDKEYEDYESIDYGNNFTLPELCANFRNFAASKLGLYYKEEMVRIFISALASTKLVILQGISGTGKTSLVYEPLIARDLERKFFFREVSKETNFGNLDEKGRYNIVNKSLQNCASRSFWTTISTMLPVLALIFVGADATVAFSIAMLIGLVSGIFSSLFIAPSLWLILEKGHMRRLKEKAIRDAEKVGQKKSNGPDELTVVGIND